MAASIGRTLDYFISEGARGLPVVTTGLDRKTITYASPAAVALFGYVNGQMIGLPAKELYSVKHERDRLLEELGILEASGSGGETSAHVFLQRKDGTPFLAKVDLFLVKPNGHVEGTAGITQLYGNMNPGLKRELARMQRLTELETRMDLKQHYLEGHAERVGQLCKEISQVMNPD